MPAASCRPSRVPVSIRIALSAGLAALLPACGPADAPPELPAPPPASAVDVAAPIEIRNAAMPRAGILAGGQPTPEQLRAAADAGYVAVIDLRTAGENDFDERALVEELGMSYTSIPVAGADGLTREAAVALDAALESAGGGPVLVHCASGNRVGALFALREHWIAGAEPDAAIAFGKRAGLTSLEEPVRQRLGGR